MLTISWKYPIFIKVTMIWCWCNDVPYDIYAINIKFNNPPISYVGDRETYSHSIVLLMSSFSSSWVLFVSFFSFGLSFGLRPLFVSPYFDSHYRIMTRNSTGLLLRMFMRNSLRSSYYSHPPTLIQIMLAKSRMQKNESAWDWLLPNEPNEN